MMRLIVLLSISLLFVNPLGAQVQNEKKKSSEQESVERTAKKNKVTQENEKQAEQDEKNQGVRKATTTRRISDTRVNDLTFDDIAFEMDKDEPFQRSMLTKKIEQLHKKKVRLSGYIRPSFKQTGITQFIFVRDNKECCFGPGAAIYDCVLVKLKEGESADYTVRPITVEGEFYLKAFKGPDKKVWAIYRMKDAFVK